MDKIIRDIEVIIGLSKKIVPELKKGKIRRVKAHLNRIIAFDIDELRRLQREEGNRRVIDECLMVLKEAKRALLDVKSANRLEEAKQLVEHIERIEAWELSNIRLRAHHIGKILGFHLEPKVFDLSDRDYLTQSKEELKKIKGYENFSYGDEFFLGMREIFKRLLKDPSLKFEYVAGSDSLCALCEHRKECTDLNHIYHEIASKADAKSAIEHPGLAGGSKYDAELILEIYRRKGWLT